MCVKCYRNVKYTKMDNRITEFEKELRIALARIVSDLIMADKIIDSDEVEKFAELFDGYNKRELFRNAQELTFAQAMKLLARPEDSASDSEQMRRLNAAARSKRSKMAAELLFETANSDGYCAPSEAILLLCIDYYLRKNNTGYTKYDVYSYRLNDIFVGKRFVLYSDFSNSPKRCDVEKHYDLIANLLAGIGFQFIYIPKVVEKYKKMGIKVFKNMSMYMFPDIADEKIEEIYSNLLGMTTNKFIQEYLNGKLGFKISTPSPAFLVMLGRSSRLGKDLSKVGLPYETYANFLKIKIDNDDVLDVISDFVCNFNKYVSFSINIDFNPSKEKLLYHGIHKAFFRLVALAKENPNNCTIDINTAMDAIFINDKKLVLQLRFRVIFALILCRSFFGDKKGLPTVPVYEKMTAVEKAEIQREYETVYAYMRNLDYIEEKKLLYSDVRTRISKIRDTLFDTVDKKYRSEIKWISGSYIKLDIMPERVTINGKPIKEHPEWKLIVRCSD